MGKQGLYSKNKRDKIDDDQDAIWMIVDIEMQVAMWVISHAFIEQYH